MTNEDGTTSEYELRDAVGNILQSEAFVKFKSTAYEFVEEIQTKGFKDAWEELKYSLDPDGTQHALKVLGLTSNVTKEQVRKAYKKLALKYHPDKVDASSDDDVRQDMNKRFLKIQKAYELLSESRYGHDEL